MTENPFDNYNNDNPFAADEYGAPADNPFAQPAYSQTTTTTTTHKDDSDSSSSSSSSSSSHKYNYTPSMPTTSSSSGSQFKDPVTGVPITDDDLRRREEMLARREREIEALENRVSSGDIPKVQTRKNFPPLLKWWAYHPDEDLPEKSVTIAKQIFYVYLATVAVYLINCIGCFCCLASAEHTSSPATKIVLSLLFLIIFCPISFEVSYFVLYDALARGKALRFFCFMATYIIWCGILVFNLIGIDDSGSVGYIQMINLFGGPAGVAIIALIFCILGTLDVAAMVFTFIRLFRYYKSEGLEKKAYGEAAVIAAEKAKENKDTIIDVAKENPEFVANAAATATTYAYE
ncbi:Secretory carrier-associated membrane protein 1 [Histomonas meleagridis]|uniref:Secretory carrier-associated membrane protein 1 n=1 Tax=Histomonas meleagridis TaxID=135588 RepID=UPI00355ABE57|nr:Secretory carrier-associated membrane protein 1 [Histomonas meleagridis]KAH0798470.1 Secretory carrier-associated membrane protein 1 [Histomonas meleagridis]